MMLYNETEKKLAFRAFLATLAVWPSHARKKVGLGRQSMYYVLSRIEFKPVSTRIWKPEECFEGIHASLRIAYDLNLLKAHR